MSDNILYIGDNLEVMKKLKDNSVDCILTDPPYKTTNNKLTYKDNRKDQEWLDFMEPRMRECHRILKKTGTLLIFIDSNMQAELQTLLYKVFNKRNYITTFIWKKKLSSSAQSKFATVEHEYIIAVAKDIKHCRWNELVQFPKEVEE